MFTLADVLAALDGRRPTGDVPVAVVRDVRVELAADGTIDESDDGFRTFI